MNNKNSDVRNWIEFLGRRHFLRDGRKTIETEEETLKVFREEIQVSIDHHRKRLTEAIHELERLRFLSIEQWKDELKKANAEEIRIRDKLNREAAKIKWRNEKRRKALSELLLKDIAKNTREVMNDELKYLNLDSIKRQEKKHEPEIWAYADIENFKKNILKHALWNIDYHKEEITEKQKEQVEQSERYKWFLKDVKEFFS